jgi:hypothetical protein
MPLADTGPRCSGGKQPALQRISTRLFHMGKPAPIPNQLDEPPVHDPHSVAQAYRYHRARRAARIQRRRDRRWARLRFWLVLGCLLLAVAVICVLILQQVQNIFGI